MNEVLRDDYVEDCQRGVDHWNQVIRKHGIDVQPPAAAPRLSPGDRDLRRDARLPGRRGPQPGGVGGSTRGVAPDRPRTRPSSQSLMVPVVERGKFASWIAPPARGINGNPVDFEYVRS